MGEVYQARDTRLNRTVAIKVVRGDLRNYPELHQRFEREARVISSLNHPNICILYDIGQHQDRSTDSEPALHYFVMEFVEGQTLAERLEGGALPLDQALRHAIEMADALDYAHRHGVVHRDLKPGNVILTRSGAKLLDFGLARLRLSGAGGANVSALATEHVSATMQGTILGTVQYMAPEQVEGREVDARTDLFAFGAVLYEMVTGRKAFEGRSQASLISAILRDNPPPISALQPVAPSSLDHVVRTSLAKDPEDRWQSAADVKRQLTFISEERIRTQSVGPNWSSITASNASALGQTGVPSMSGLTGTVRTEVSARATTQINRRSGFLWGVVAGVLAGALVGGAILWTLTLRSRSGSPSATHVLVEMEPEESSATPGTPTNAAPRPRRFRSAIALSPDGQRLVFVAAPRGKPQLFLRTFDRFEATPIAGTEGAATPVFFSSDGRWIGFWSDGALKKVSSAGGPAVEICRTPQPSGASWGTNDVIVFAGMSAGLSRVPASGGKAEEFTKLDEKAGEIGHRIPHVLPGGEVVLYTVASGETTTDYQVVVQALKTGERRVLLENAADARYVSTGHLVFARAGTLMAAPFDINTLTLTGGALGVQSGVMQALNELNTGNNTGAAQFTFSDSGVLAYMSGGIHLDREDQLAWVDRRGGVQTVPLPK
jgi:serine/threonine protein kinase